MKSTIIEGQKINSLTFTGKRKNDNKRWLGEFLCDCGNSRYLRFDCVLRQVYKSCGCKGSSTDYKNRRKLIGDNYPFHVLITLFRKNSKKRKIPFELEIDDLKSQYEKQKGKCCYTQKSIIMPANFLEIYKDDIASIDRIDSSLGYVSNNIQLVTKVVNMAKQTLSHNDFVLLCHTVANACPL